MDRINNKLRNEDLILLKMEEISDWQTFIHSVRVGFITEEILKFMKEFNLEDCGIYSDSEKKHIVRGAFLHDCGKTLNGLNLQQLPRKLKSTEFIVITNHVIIGSMFVENFPEIIKNIVLYHHSIPVEQNNYIKFPQDEEVPKYLELIALVDKFDAIISDRPYHTGKNPQDVLKELEIYHFWGFKTLNKFTNEILNNINEKMDVLIKKLTV